MTNDTPPQTDQTRETQNTPRERFLDDLCTRLQTLIQNTPLHGLKQMGADGKQNLRALVLAALGNLNVVTREEFEAHNAILADAVAKLSHLETQLELAKQPPPPPAAATPPPPPPPPPAAPAQTRESAAPPAPSTPDSDK